MEYIFKIYTPEYILHSVIWIELFLTINMTIVPASVNYSKHYTMVSRNMGFIQPFMFERDIDSKEEEEWNIQGCLKVDLSEW